MCVCFCLEVVGWSTREEEAFFRPKRVLLFTGNAFERNRLGSACSCMPVSLFVLFFILFFIFVLYFCLFPLFILVQLKFQNVAKAQRTISGSNSVSYYNFAFLVFSIIFWPTLSWSSVMGSESFLTFLMTANGQSATAGKSSFAFGHKYQIHISCQPSGTPLAYRVN